MHLRYSYRICPTAGQRQALARTFGCARVVYNDALAARKQARRDGRPYPRSADLQKLVITGAKRTAERAWLASVAVDPLIQSLRDLDTAYRNFFDSVSGRRAGRQVGLPRFKSKRDSRQSLRFTRNGFRIRGNGKLNLAKIGDVRVKWSRALPADPSSVTVVLDPSGRYHVSFVVDVEPQHLPALDTEVGIDLGLTTYAVLSDGTVIDNPASCGRPRRSSRPRSAPCPARPRAARTGRRPDAGSPRHTPRWPTPARTGHTGRRPGSSAKRKRCTWRT